MWWAVGVTADGWVVAVVGRQITQIGLALEVVNHPSCKQGDAPQPSQPRRDSQTTTETRSTAEPSRIEPRHRLRDFYGIQNVQRPLYHEATRLCNPRAHPASGPTSTVGAPSRPPPATTESMRSRMRHS